MTPQEIFDKVATHLLTQNKQSREGIICLYRGPDGTACAVGCLIPDSLYKKGMEGSAAESIIKFEDGLQDVFFKRHESTESRENKLRLLSDLQEVHDRCEVSGWKDRLKITASVFSLNASVLNNF